MVTIDQLRAPSPDPWLNVFIDESGTNELDLLKQNVMRYFIVAAVFVDDDQAHSACTKLEQIALELCGGAEIMSKRIGSKHETRRRFLEAIQPIDFGYAALAVDKSLIATHPGLRYKRTFHKFFARMLQGRLTRYGGGLRVFSDEFGDSEFMRGFDAYLNENVPPNLFFEYEHEFVSSASSRLIQLADLIAGSISYWLEPGKRSESSEMFRELLRPKETDIVAWPLPRRPPTVLVRITLPPQGRLTRRSRKWPSCALSRFSKPWGRAVTPSTACAQPPSRRCCSRDSSKSGRAAQSTRTA